MRVTATIKHHVTRERYGREASCDEENEVVGDVVDRGEEEPLITIESVDGVPARGLTQRERDEYGERLWWAYLDQTEAA